MPSSGSTVAYPHAAQFVVLRKPYRGKPGCYLLFTGMFMPPKGNKFFKYISDIMNRAAILPPTASVESYRELLPDKWHKS